jgi:ATP-binding cassette subfamily B protein/ATP-binding cassette subfamily C protein
MTEFPQTILGKLNQLLDKRKKAYLAILLVLSIFLSLVETVSVSIVMVFISVASNPELLNSGWYRVFFRLSGFIHQIDFIIFFGILIIFFYGCRAVYTVVYNYLLNRYALGNFRQFSVNLFKKYITLPYKVYVQKNSSVLAQKVISEANNLSQLLLNLLQVFSESFTVILIYVFLIWVNWQMTLVLTAVLVLAVYLIFVTLVRKSREQGVKRTEANEKLYKTLGESFGNFKFIKLKGNEESVFNTFDTYTGKFSRTQIITQTLGVMPRSILENIGFSLLVAIVIFILWRYDSIVMIIPVITMYALALYRMLPALNKILGCFNQIAYYQHSLDIIYEDLNIPVETEGVVEVQFEKSIRVEDAAFQYLVGEEVIKNASFEIKKGEKIAFTGESGSGKTTLVDILIGIYKPSRGKVYVDDSEINYHNVRSWRSKIGYIPQDIYLFDGTVAENVAFGLPRDEKKIITALKKANVWEFLEKKEGVFTRVGEDGIQLSGGQKQRIGIARALYGDPDVLVLDEATSSLDNETEAKIMDEIYDVSSNKTLIVIAHRLSTVDRCDRQIRIDNGCIAESVLRAGIH